MPNWTECTTENASTYLALLRSSAAVYAETKPEELDLLLGKRPGRAFIYQDEKQGFYFLLLMTPSPSNPDILKMVHAIPGGNFDPAETVRIVITKIRQLLDELGAPVPSNARTKRTSLMPVLV
ncbi:hypothetical protein Pla110_43530 [Polystyrenella longa]|uniref:Uncharacterized protein n=1 Tax=Polystyrenella longa TaxID=2528007 RepID=A0A518CTQ4_9PLAN|nr:hypothetical protein [Polystyrenella longa]QDU82593.1 hypothetical protein Pla110_43530 [Polystyrenella longa]